MKTIITAYFVLIFGMPIMLLITSFFEFLSGPGSGWLAYVIPVANWAIFMVLIIISHCRYKLLHILGGAVGIVAIYFVGGIVWMMLNPNTALEGIQ